MPKPIVCLSEELCQYLESFRSCFSKRQWKYFVTVLLGLVECEERKTLSGLLRLVAERISLSGLSRFFSKWSWSPAEVARVWMERFRQRLDQLVQAEHQRLKAEMPKSIGRPPATVVTGYLIFDDSVHVKPKGRKMGGLGQLYSDSERRNVIGHCLFTGLYVLLGQHCPLPMQMYRQKSVCQQEGVPFESKIQMATHQIESFEPAAGTATHVLIDSWYHCQEVRRAAQKRGWDVSGGLKSNRVMRLISEEGQRQWIKLSAYAASLQREDWSEVTWPSEQGGQKMYAHLVQTWVRKLGPTLLLVTCHNLDEPLKSVRYWGSTLLNLDAQALVNILAIRWNIETFFEYDKDLLGSDHYQLMTAQAILRFWTLIACLMCFLEEQRAACESSPFTCGDARLQIQQQHQINLLLWLKDQFQSNSSFEQISAQLTL
ncbi:MAG TPA: transposase [Anaerolineales bacterium]